MKPDKAGLVGESGTSRHYAPVLRLVEEASAAPSSTIGTYRVADALLALKLGDRTDEISL